MQDKPLELPPGYVLDVVSDPNVLMLRRLDGSSVAVFSARGADPTEIRKAAEVDRRRCAVVNERPPEVLRTARIAAGIRPLRRSTPYKR
jgi:hypothetical protein